MRVLFISNLYPPYVLGGMELRCHEVVQALLQRGHTCHVLTSRYGVTDRSPFEGNVTRSLHMQADIHNYRPLDFFLRRPFQHRANRTALLAAMDSFQPDVVFVWGMWNLSPAIVCWAELQLPGRVAYNIGSYWPLDVDPHTTYWSRAGQSSSAKILLWPVSRLALGILKAQQYPPHPQFSHVSCCSQYVADTLTKAGSIPPGALTILNGIDPEPYVTQIRSEYAQDAVMRLLYFGGLSRNKGVHTAIEALGVLRQRNQANKVHLTIIGGGHPDYEAHLRELTQSLDLENRISFIGRVPRSEIPRVLAGHDVFLFTSIWDEPFGRTILEAMAAGLAVIGTGVGGSREIFQYYTGDTLFLPGNADALAHQILRLSNDPGLIHRLQQAGQALVLQRFTLDRMVDEIEAWLCQLVLDEVS